MSPRRRLSAAVSAGSMVLALTACSGLEKPAPIVSIVSSGTSLYTEAQVFCFEGQTLAEANCARRATEVKELKVRAGQPVGIDLSKEVAERSWIYEIGEGEQRQQSEVRVDDHYYSLQLSIGSGVRVPLVIRTVDVENQVPTGEWQFVLVGE